MRKILLGVAATISVIIYLLREDPMVVLMILSALALFAATFYFIGKYA